MRPHRKKPFMILEKPMRRSTQERFKCGKGAKCDKCFQHQVPWRSMRGPTQGRSLSNARSVTRASPSRNRTSSLHQVTWNPWEDPLRRNSIQVHKVWQVFSTSSSLKEHEWEDPHRREAFQMVKVRQDYKSFSIAGHLKEHERTHKREKPFKCSKCDKSVSTAGHLKKHVRTHTGEKPFKCKKCARASQFQVAWNFQVGNPWEDPLRRYSIQVHIVWQDYLMRHETTQERRHASAQSVTSVFQDQVPWRSIRGPILPSIPVNWDVQNWSVFII